MRRGATSFQERQADDHRKEHSTAAIPTQTETGNSVSRPGSSPQPRMHDHRENSDRSAIGHQQAVFKPCQLRANGRNFRAGLSHRTRIGPGWLHQRNAGSGRLGCGDQNRAAVRCPAGRVTGNNLRPCFWPEQGRFSDPFMRFCVHCKKEIPQEVMVKARWKALFCSPLCKQEDRNEIRRQRKALRALHGQCRTCGRKLPNARVHAQTTAVPEAVAAAT